MYGTYALFQIRQMPMQISMTKKNVIMSRAAMSAPTCCHINAHRTPTSPTRVNLRAQHVSIKEPNTCQSTSRTRVNLVTIHVYAASRLKQFSDRGKIVMDVTISMTKYTKSSRCNSYDATKMTKTISSQHRHKYMSMTFLAFTMTKVDCLGCGLFQQWISKFNKHYC